MRPSITSAPTVLVVDDDRVTTSRLGRALQREGYGVVVAHDGEMALALLAQNQSYAAMILDRRMPGMDGLQVLQHMKRTSNLKEIPVVMATGMNSEHDIWEGVKHGAYYYLSKPLQMSVLLQVLAAAIADGARNRKLWAEMEFARTAIGLIQQGVFRYQTMQQCEQLAALLANSCPDPQRVSVGLFELMLNALEHGNLGITYAEKTALIEARTWSSEILRREQLPENRDRFVTISLNRTPGKQTRFRIQDLGQGFPWQDFQKISPDRIFDNHGRGILLAKWEAFDRVTYQGTGNCVTMEVKQP